MDHCGVSGDTSVNTSTQKTRRRPCAVLGCPHRDSMHQFPKEKPTIHKAWIRFLKLKNPGFSYLDHSRICSRHFSSDSFSNWGSAKLGFVKRLHLQKDAIPTIYGENPDFADIETVRTKSSAISTTAAVPSVTQTSPKFRSTTHNSMVLSAPLASTVALSAAGMAVVTPMSTAVLSATREFTAMPSDTKTSTGAITMPSVTPMTASVPFTALASTSTPFGTVTSTATTSNAVTSIAIPSDTAASTAMSSEIVTSATSPSATLSPATMPSATVTSTSIRFGTSVSAVIPPVTPTSTAATSAVQTTASKPYLTVMSSAKPSASLRPTELLSSTQTSTTVPSTRQISAALTSTTLSAASLVPAPVPFATSTLTCTRIAAASIPAPSVNSQPMLTSASVCNQEFIANVYDTALSCATPNALTSVASSSLNIDQLRLASKTSQKVSPFGVSVVTAPITVSTMKVSASKTMPTVIGEQLPVFSGDSTIGGAQAAISVATIASTTGTEPFKASLSSDAEKLLVSSEVCTGGAQGITSAVGSPTVCTSKTTVCTSKTLTTKTPLLPTEEELCASSEAFTDGAHAISSAVGVVLGDQKLAVSQADCCSAYKSATTMAQDLLPNGFSANDPTKETEYGKTDNARLSTSAPNVTACQSVLPTAVSVNFETAETVTVSACVANFAATATSIQKTCPLIRSVLRDDTQSSLAPNPRVVGCSSIHNSFSQTSGAKATDNVSFTASSVSLHSTTLPVALPSTVEHTTPTSDRVAFISDTGAASITTASSQISSSMASSATNNGPGNSIVKESTASGYDIASSRLPVAELDVTINSESRQQTVKNSKMCVAENCYGAERLFCWPHKTQLANRWTAFVKAKIDDFDKTSYSRLCFRHFTEDMFSNYGFYKRRRDAEVVLTLKHMAVPTVHLEKGEFYSMNSPRKANATSRLSDRERRLILRQALAKPMPVVERVVIRAKRKLPKPVKVKGPTREDKGCQTLKQKERLRPCCCKKRPKHRSTSTQYDIKHVAQARKTITATPHNSSSTSGHGKSRKMTDVGC